MPGPPKRPGEPMPGLLGRRLGSFGPDGREGSVRARAASGREVHGSGNGSSFWETVRPSTLATPARRLRPEDAQPKGRGDDCIAGNPRSFPPGRRRPGLRQPWKALLGPGAAPEGKSTTKNSANWAIATVPRRIIKRPFRSLAPRGLYRPSCSSLHRRGRRGQESAWRRVRRSAIRSPRPWHPGPRHPGNRSRPLQGAVLLVKAVAEDGKGIGGFRHDQVRPWPLARRNVRRTASPSATVDFMPENDGRWSTTGLLPDEGFTLTVEAEGYEPKSEKLKLPEGAVKELEVRLKRK